MSALAAGMITTAELIGILKAAGISVAIIGAGQFLLRGIKVMDKELEKAAKETRKCLKCTGCTGYRPNLVSAGQKLVNDIGSNFFGAPKDTSVAYRACMCGHHINYHSGH